jgi:hypothetical protein
MFSKKNVVRCTFTPKKSARLVAPTLAAKDFWAKILKHKDAKPLGRTQRTLKEFIL